MPTPPKTASNYEAGNDSSNTSHALEEIHVNTHPPSTLVEEVKVFNDNGWQSFTTTGCEATDRTCSGKAVETLGIRTPNQRDKLQKRRNEEGWTSAQVQPARNPEKVL